MPHLTGSPSGTGRPSRRLRGAVAALLSGALAAFLLLVSSQVFRDPVLIVSCLPSAVRSEVVAGFG
ncbi:hypothetical protein [Streptomyces tendae]